jgi:hypothetical protein
MSELVLSESMVPLGKPFALTPTALVVNNGDALTIEDGQQAARKLKVVHGALAYWMGDLIDIMERTFGEQAAQVIDADFLDEKLVNQYRFVAKAVAPPMRALAPSWEHAKAVAHLKPAAQEKWLQQAFNDDWIASKLRSEIDKAGDGAKTGMRFLIIVDAQTEAKQKALAAQLEKDGFACTLRSSVKRERKGKKARKAAAPKVGKRKGGARAYQRKKGGKK